MTARETSAQCQLHTRSRTTGSLNPDPNRHPPLTYPNLRHASSGPLSRWVRPGTCSTHLTPLRDRLHALAQSVLPVLSAQNFSRLPVAAWLSEFGPPLLLGPPFLGAARVPPTLLRLSLLLPEWFIFPLSYSSATLLSKYNKIWVDWIKLPLTMSPAG